MRIATDCQAGYTLEEIDKKYPQFVLLHKKKLEDYLTFQNQLKEKNSKKAWEPHILPLDTSSPNFTIWNWINMNIKTKRKFKEKQLYIWGPPNLGKTSLIIYLETMLTVYWVPMDEEFYDDWLDNHYDLAVLDEFKGQKTVQWLNRFLQGGPMSIRKKGSQSRKTQNIPVMILSNYSLEDCYKKMAEQNIERLESLKARLEIVEVTQYIEIAIPQTDYIPDSPVIPATPPSDDNGSEDEMEASYSDLELFK